jgi:methyltransferase
MFAAALGALAFVPMILEARLAARNARALRRAGAVEPAGDVYNVMQVAYPACFLAMIGEGWLRGMQPGLAAAAGLAVFSSAKALKYWAIASLGERWTFRVLVPPGSTRSARGPYGFLHHPNYVGVVGELVGMGLMAHAPVSGALSVAGFGVLMLARVRIEERALGMRPEVRNK